MSILIAESGSSKTDWRLIAKNGAISQLKTIGFNPYFQDEETIFQEINNEIVPKLTENVAQVFYYGTGVTNIEKADIIKNALKKAMPRAAIEVNDDMLAAARSLCLYQPGIPCILGTGSNSCLFDGQKVIDQVPSLGFWLGDEGSGGYLGKELIKRYIRKELPIEIHQKFIPVDEQVYGACELLGLDPLYVANEGVFIAIVDKNIANDLLRLLQKDENGTNAITIGEVTESHPRQVILNSNIGGKRVVNMLVGEQLPRIC